MRLDETLSGSREKQGKKTWWPFVTSQYGCSSKACTLRRSQRFVFVFPFPASQFVCLFFFTKTKIESVYFLHLLSADWLTGTTTAGRFGPLRRERKATSRAATWPEFTTGEGSTERPHGLPLWRRSSRGERATASKLNVLRRCVVLFVACSWLFEGVERQKAEELLALPSNRPGSFMVRESFRERGANVGLTAGGINTLTQGRDRFSLSFEKML